MDIFLNGKMRTLFTALVTAAVLNATPSHAAFCSRTLSFVDGAVLTAAQLNDELNAITNCANSIDNANVASSAAILPEKLNSTIAGDGIARDGATGVLSVNDDDSSLTISSDILSIKASGVTTAKIADSNVTTAKIADSNVTTAKIADLNVTRPKMVAVGQQISSNIGSIWTNVSSVTYSDITNLTVTITTTGRPVILQTLSGTATGVGSDISVIQCCKIKLLRDATDVAVFWRGNNSPSASVYDGSQITHIDPVAAGTYTYKLQGLANSSCTCSLFGATKLAAYEL